ncbi:MAG: LLM class flavin-dependent oxidoreductase [Chloroflexi bacterium]|nr:LLM class flavin-dependent oxidoreductase [Chloroflexota bacterium]
MGVRIGLVTYVWPFAREAPEVFYECIARCEEQGLDSLWVTDSRMQPRLNLDPVVAMTAIAARTHRLRFGTAVMVLPTRNPLILARQIAALDFFSGGRTILGVGIAVPHKVPEGVVRGYGLATPEAPGRLDEMIPLLRKLWTERDVSHHGKYYHVDGMNVFPRPVQQPCTPIWIGGNSEAALRRTGRLGDGWLPYDISAEDCHHGREAILRYAQEYGRTLEDDNFGAYLPFCIADSLAEAEKLARTRVAANNLLGTPHQVRARMREYIDAGVRRFVMNPIGPADQFMQQVDLLAKEIVAPLQTHRVA